MSPFLVLLWLLLPLSALAQAINITEGVQTYASLTNTTVTLTGKSELRLTSTAPLSTSLVHLNSPDAWVLFTAVKPSVVVSSYLSQIRVNGASAVSGSNVRVVQYELGAVVIPHAPSFQPLQAFTGRDFSGTSRTFATYTYYNSTAALGSFNREISSFKLKRGYMATFSTQTNGSGPSQVYIAQDADLEIGRLSSAMDNEIRYVRVFPWRWVSKKGSCDVAPATLNASWHYNWDNNQNSPLDWEYVPIRQQRWWPGYPDNKPDSTHLLGFNEPDNSVEDSYTSLGNGSVDTAIAVWPELLASGLRVGSPAVTDGGLSWLYDFMTKADAAKLRVDYVAIHFYRCGYTAQQLYDWLYAIHVNTGRPIWITEFNNGANWTTCADPTYAQNSTRISEFIDMMDSAPWIERYAVYSRVEGVRQMTYDEGGLTPAGVVYRDNASPLSYRQRLPGTGARAMAQLAFDGDTLDSSGHGNNALVGRPVFVAGRSGQALRLDGATQHVQLPTAVAASSSFSFAAWVYWDGGANWQRIFDFGADTQRYAFLTPSATGGLLRFATRNNGSEQIVQTGSALPIGQWTHVAFTLSGGVGRLYLNGVQAASGAISITPSQLGADLNYLGKSQFPVDPLFAGRLDDVRIADYAFSSAQIAAMQGANTAPQFSSTTLAGGSATQNQAYVGTLVGTAIDADAGDTLAYAKVSGPAWLQVAANGALSGTPGFADDGLQEFVVSVTDATGASDSAVLTINMPVVTGNGTWSADADGLWSDVTKWTSAFPANGIGASANFSSINISADRTVTLDSSRAIGSMSFGDSSGVQNWTLASADGASLTLDSGVTTTSPTITVNQNTATLSLPLEGSNGLTKGGNGTLVLSGGGSLSGTLNIDTSSNTTAQGALRVAHPDALSDISTIQIRTNNSGSSTLELSDALGGISTAAGVTLSGRNTSVSALRNISGVNSLGVVTVQSGGATYGFQSDAGTLVLGGLTSGATGTRTITFGGSGGFNLAGVASNGSADAGLGLVKNGSGRLTLSAANTFTGSVNVNGGTLAILGSGALYAGAWNTTAVLTVNTGGVLELDRWGYGPTHASYRTQALGGLSYAAARFVINGGTVRFTGGAAGAPQNPAEAPYGPGFTIGAAGAALEAAKVSDTWTVKFDSRGGGEIVSVAGGSLILTGAGDGIFDKVLPGSGALVKSGSGTWTLPHANTYTGATTITAGVLRITGSTAGGALTVAPGGTLSGTGTVGGASTVQSGAVIAPGLNGIGNLTFTGNLALSAGSTTRLEIHKSVGARDRLIVGGTLTLGGTLEVANLGGSLVLGDSFALFTAGARSGAFATFSLPALGAGLEWDSSTLGTDGTLRVVESVPNYAAWSAAQSFAPGEEGLALDPDGDGLANALEWLLGADPLAPDPANHPVLALRPVTVADWPSAEEGKNYLTLTARVRKVHAGMTIVAQASTSLETLDAAGSSIPVASFVASDLGEFEERTWVYTLPLEDSNGRAFMRLKAVAE